MAMNNSNYGYSPSSYSPSGYSPSGYSPSGFSTPYSSTPSAIRSQRPRFGYSGPSLYPRPRSSASKPNPDSLSESMMNNYGSSASRIDTTFNSSNGSSYNDSYNNSNYYTANESFYPENQSCGDGPMLRDSSAMYDNRDMTCNNPGMMRGDRSFPHGDIQNIGLLAKPKSSFAPGNFMHNSTANNTEFKGKFKKNSAFGSGNKNIGFQPRKFNKAKRQMATRATAWRCELCSLDFTSQIPYDMHLRGAKHAKKMKAKQALSTVQAIQSQAVKDALFCELCNVKANSSLQLQTHLEGSKHKNKLQPKEPKDPTQDTSKETIKTEANTSVNGKTNGSLTRPLPADFGEPQPSKLAKFACDVCNVTVNSEIQLQQHLSSKKHQNKVEGKPVVKRMKTKVENKTEETNATDNVEATTELEPASNETSTKVLGVKTLASSFVQGETLQ